VRSGQGEGGLGLALVNSMIFSNLNNSMMIP